MINIKAVEYDDLNCSMNTDAICPYCGHENEIILESESDGEAEETECENCEKTFMYTLRVSINFDTQPVENYYLQERERLLKRVERYEVDATPHSWKTEMVMQLKHDLSKFDKWIEGIIGGGRNGR